MLLKRGQRERLEGGQKRAADGLPLNRERERKSGREGQALAFFLSFSRLWLCMQSVCATIAPHLLGPLKFCFRDSQLGTSSSPSSSSASSSSSSCLSSSAMCYKSTKMALVIVPAGERETRKNAENFQFVVTFCIFIILYILYIYIYFFSFWYFTEFFLSPWLIALCRALEITARLLKRCQNVPQTTPTSCLPEAATPTLFGPDHKVDGW